MQESNSNLQETIIKSLNWRYAAKTFDPNKKITQEELNTILESGRLSPSSFGIEAWKFIVVENPEVRTKLRAASWDQTKVTDASHLIVIAYRTDGEKIAPELLERIAKIQDIDVSTLAGFKQMLEGAITNKKNDGSLESWIKAQAYIPFGIMAETAALLGIDTCPMEGFMPDQVDAILGLKEKNLHSVTMLAVGHRSAEDQAAQKPKVRRSFDEVVEFVK